MSDLFVVGLPSPGAVEAIVDWSGRLVGARKARRFFLGGVVRTVVQGVVLDFK